MLLKTYIVEDSEIIRKRVMRLISGFDFVEIIGWSDDPDSAISNIEMCLPDAVILDISIKDGNGIKMIGEIKKRVPHTIIIMFTNFDIKNYREQAFRFGADYYLDKSNDFTKLSGILECIKKSKLTKNH